VATQLQRIAQFIRKMTVNKEAFGYKLQGDDKKAYELMEITNKRNMEKEIHGVVLSCEWSMFNCEQCKNKVGAIYYDDTTGRWKCQRCADENKKLLSNLKQ
jgi:formylmethanofuran dehydrogenase subunit E